MLFFFLLFLAVFNRFIYRSSLNPIFLQSVLWLVYYVLLAANIKTYDIYLNQVNLFIVLQSIGFSLGGFICFLFSKKSSVWETKNLNETTLDTLQKNILFLFPLFFFILCVSFVVLAKTSGSISFAKLADMREALVEDDGKKSGSFGIIQLILSVYLSLYIISKKQFYYRFTVFYFIFFYFTGLLGGKGPFFFFFSSLLYILLWQKKINISKVFFAIVLIFGLFTGITLLRTNSAYNTDIGFLTDVLLTYSITSLPALVLISHTTSPFFGYQTFRGIYVWVNKFGFSIPLAPVLQEYAITPLPTNVYSYIRPYFIDFRYWGVFLIPLVLGFLNNYVFFRAKQGRIGSFAINALLISPLIMQFFDEQYFRWFTAWLYFAVLIALLTKVKFYEIKLRKSTLQPTS